jgi:hypothetical protein
LFRAEVLGYDDALLPAAARGAGFAVETTVDKIGVGLTAVAAAGMAAHAIGSAIRKKAASPTEEAQTTVDSAKEKKGE